MTVFNTMFVFFMYEHNHVSESFGYSYLQIPEAFFGFRIAYHNKNTFLPSGCIVVQFPQTGKMLPHKREHKNIQIISEYFSAAAMNEPITHVKSVLSFTMSIWVSCLSLTLMIPLVITRSTSDAFAL